MMTGAAKSDEYPQDIWDMASDEALKYVEWLTPKPNEYAAAEYVLTMSFARVLTAERESCAAMFEQHPFHHVVAEAVRNRGR